jgi:hypothetical protein
MTVQSKTKKKKKKKIYISRDIRYIQTNLEKSLNWKSHEILTVFV